MVRIYYLPSYSRLRGVYYVLDANLGELVQSELKPVRTLVQLMDSHTSWVQYQASRVLQKLARDGESQLHPSKDILFISTAEKCQSEIIKADGLNPLLRLLRGTDLGLTYLAVSFVCNLAAWPMNRPLIVEAGFLPPLVLALKNGEIQLGVAKALGTLAASTENNKLEIFNAGAVQSIKDLIMEAGAGVQIEMITCIRNLSCSGMSSPLNHVLKSDPPLDGLRGRMSEMGINGVLVRLSTYSLHPEVKYESRAALRDLAKGRATNFWHSIRIRLAL